MFKNNDYYLKLIYLRKQLFLLLLRFRLHYNYL